MMVASNDKPQRGGSDDKLLGIELLRFASAIAVLVFHYQHLAFVGTTQVNFEKSRQPFYGLLAFLYQYGFHGVQVFWCISGFIFFWKYGAVLSGKRMDGYAFFVLRLSRLYPLHLLTLLFMVGAQWIYFSQHEQYFIYSANDVYHFIQQLFMASNWTQEVESFNGPIWSISVEVLIYAVFFLSLRYISGRTPVIAAIALIATAVVASKLLAYDKVFVCAMFFYLGCLTAILYARVKDSATQRTVVAALCAAAIATLSVAQFFVTIKPMYFLVVFSPALIFLCTAYVRPGKAGSRVLESLGSVTYSSYLLHVPVQIAIVIICTWAGLSVPFYNGVFFLAFMGFVLALSFWCYRFFEVPAQNAVRRRLKRAPVRTVATVQASP
jgi:peptidoglycan/LPS O-acetylase OafA/YrhL